MTPVAGKTLDKDCRKIIEDDLNETGLDASFSGVMKYADDESLADNDVVVYETVSQKNGAKVRLGFLFKDTGDGVLQSREAKGALVEIESARSMSYIRLGMDFKNWKAREVKLPQGKKKADLYEDITGTISAAYFANTKGDLVNKPAAEEKTGPINMNKAGAFRNIAGFMLDYNFELDRLTSAYKFPDRKSIPAQQ